MLDLLNLMGTKTVTYKIRRTTKKQMDLAYKQVFRQLCLLNMQADVWHVPSAVARHGCRLFTKLSPAPPRCTVVVIQA